MALGGGSKPCNALEVTLNFGDARRRFFEAGAGGVELCFLVCNDVVGLGNTPIQVEQIELVSDPECRNIPNELKAKSQKKSGQFRGSGKLTNEDADLVPSLRLTLLFRLVLLELRLPHVFVGLVPCHTTNFA